MAPVFPWYRLGYVIPHRHTDLDSYQFARVAPDGMMLITTGLDLKEYSLAAVEDELPTLYSGIDILARTCDSISISGVPLAASLGRDRTHQLLAECSDRVGMEVTTDIEAHIAAMKHFGADKIAIASRWPDALNQKVVDYLGAEGIEVQAIRAHQRDLQQNKAASPEGDHELALQLGREVAASAPDAKALLLPGGLWYAIYAAPILEEELGIPVMLNITSTTWAALRGRAGALPQPVPAGTGRLLASL